MTSGRISFLETSMPHTLTQLVNEPCDFSRPGVWALHVDWSAAGANEWSSSLGRHAAGMSTRVRRH